MAIVCLGGFVTQGGCSLIGRQPLAMQTGQENKSQIPGQRARKSYFPVPKFSCRLTCLGRKFFKKLWKKTRIGGVVWVPARSAGVE